MEGRELDALVAKEVFGIDVSGGVNDAPAYSTAILAALEVLNRMRELGHRWLLNMDDEGFHLRRVACVIRDWDKDEKRYVADRPLGWAKKLEDLPRVICEAAVKEIQEARESAVKPK